MKHQPSVIIFIGFIQWWRIAAWNHHALEMPQVGYLSPAFWSHEEWCECRGGADGQGRVRLRIQAVAIVYGEV